MEITEVQKKKAALERSILNAITRFESATELLVSDVELKPTTFDTVDGEIRVALDVKVEVTL